MVKILWAWIDRPVAEDFFVIRKTPLTDAEFQKRVDEIPNELRYLVKLMYELAIERKKKGWDGKDGKGHRACLTYRCMLYTIVRNMKKKYNYDYPLPSYWYCDGPMIEPEWVVKITNGLVQFTCDDSVEQCLIGEEGRCRFYVPLEQQTMEQAQEKAKSMKDIDLHHSGGGTC
jgi:hypothetical protein